jgi:putative heme-binding domain-containing protein
MAIGPEGALYIADMCREVIEHPASLPPELKKQLDLNSGNDRGRIYRVVPKDYKYIVPPVLGGMATEQLVGELAQANAWRRITAARLLCERQDPAAAALLRKQFTTSERPESRIAVLHALQGVSVLNVDDVLKALDDHHPQVRRHAIQLAEPLLDQSNEVLTKVSSLTSDSSDVVRYQLALSLGESSDLRATDALAEIMIRDAQSRDIVDAALTSMANRAGAILKHLITNDKWIAGTHAPSLLTAIVGQIVRQRHEEDLKILLTALNSPRTLGHADGVAVLLKALSNVPPSAMAGADSPQLQELQQMRTTAAAALVKEARGLLEQDSGRVDARVAAIENLAFDSFDNQQDLLAELLSPQQPAAVHAAVLATCAEYESPAVAGLVLDQWDQFAPAQRIQATELLLRREEWALQLLQYLKDEGATLAMLDPGHIMRLENYPSPEARKLARSLRGQHIAQDRQKVFDEYRHIALAGGDASAGRQVYEKNCASCHQLGSVGQAIGPNLVSMVSRGAESVLFNVLAPNGEVDPRYLEYTLVTTDGQVLTGVIAGETSTAITLRSAENKLTTVLRVDIEELRNTGKSLMPEGLEKLIDKPAMADLLSYLQQVAAAEGAAKP